MSTVAIIAVGAVTVGSVALSAALLTLGIGLGAGFFFVFKGHSNKENKDRMLAEIDMAIYRVRADSSKLGEEFRGKLSADIQKLHKIKGDIKTAFEHDQQAGVELGIINLNETALEIRQKIEVYKLEEDALSQMPDSQLELERATKTTDLASPGIEEKMPLFENNAGVNGKDMLVHEIKRFHMLIRGLDEDTYKELATIIKGIDIESNLQRLEMIKDMVKVKYGGLKESAAWTAVFRVNLNRLVGNIRSYAGSEPLVRDVEALLAKRFISKKEYEALLAILSEFAARSEKAIVEKDAKKDLVSKLRNGLESMGYAILDEDKGIGELEEGKVVYLNTRWENYKIMARLSEEKELTTRLVRIISSDTGRKDMPEYQIQKDREVAKQWCHDYDGFVDHLVKNGIGLTIKLRKEPEEEDVICITDKDMPHHKTITAKNEVQERSREMR